MPKRQLPNLVCQVDDCQADLAPEVSEYRRRHRVCSTCLKANSVDLHGRISRWCQQCTKFHDISCFDGARRSCRERLRRHNARRRNDALAAAADTSDDEANTSSTQQSARDVQPSIMQQQATSTPYSSCLPTTIFTPARIHASMQPAGSSGAFSQHPLCDAPLVASPRMGQIVGIKREASQVFGGSCHADAWALGTLDRPAACSDVLLDVPPSGLLPSMHSGVMIGQQPPLVPSLNSLNSCSEALLLDTPSMPALKRRAASLPGWLLPGGLGPVKAEASCASGSDLSETAVQLHAQMGSGPIQISRVGQQQQQVLVGAPSSSVITWVPQGDAFESMATTVSPALSARKPAARTLSVAAASASGHHGMDAAAWDHCLQKGAARQAGSHAADLPGTVSGATHAAAQLAALPHAAAQQLESEMQDLIAEMDSQTSPMHFTSVPSSPMLAVPPPSREVSTHLQQLQRLGSLGVRSTKPLRASPLGQPQPQPQQLQQVQVQVQVQQPPHPLTPQKQPLQVQAGADLMRVISCQVAGVAPSELPPDLYARLQQLVSTTNPQALQRMLL